MPSPTLSFRNIRPHNSDQRIGFEELVRQLLIANPPDRCAYLEHKGAGADGGVEVLVHRNDGRAWGVQTKFFIDAFASSQITQLWSSFRSALTAYSNLDRYIVALPINLAGGVRSGRLSQRQKWDAFKRDAEAEALAAGRPVTIELWDESHLVSMLTRHDPVHAGMRLYWFDDLSLTPSWFDQRFTAAAADLGDRYLPQDHVSVTAEKALDILARGPGFSDAFTGHLFHYDAATDQLAKLRGRTHGALEGIDLAALEASLVAAQHAAVAASRKTQGAIDIAPIEALIALVTGHPAVEALRDLAFVDIGDDPIGTGRALRRDIDALLNPISNLRSSLTRIGTDVLHLQRLLLVGEAGAGKSHSLADLVRRHLADDAPAVLLLGQHFLAGDPRPQLLARLDLAGIPFDTFLGALQAAALAHQRPALIVIDAINESRDPRLWQANLAGLAADVARFDGLALLISCRETYESACIPAGLPLPRYVHRGFAGDGAAAAKAYLDRNGIDRPSAPFLDAEFTNPLFLSTSVRRLRALGRRAFPAGLAGTTEIFGFWIEGVEASLLARGYSRIREGDGRLRRAIGRFADELALQRTDTLPLARATELLEAEVTAFSVTGPDDELLWRLVHEGVLRREIDEGSNAEVIAFTFQRFSDHFVADALLRLCGTPGELAVALSPGGLLHDLLDARNWRFRGVVEALMTQAPEVFGVELPDLAPGFSRTVLLPVSSFLASLRWRASSATTERTVAIFEGLWDRDEDRDGLLGLLFQVCSIPGHRLNGDYLHARLSALPLPERDALLTGYFADRPEDGPSETLIDWLEDARLDLAELERVRLATNATCWFLTASSRVLRDRASRAVTAAFLTRPELIASLIHAFAGIDDPYVRERILAASAAAATHLHHARDAVTGAALAVWNTIFDRPVVERHAFIRHYARIVVETAAARGWLSPEVSLARARPPYASAPITVWPSVDDIEPLMEGANSIRSSVLGYRSEETGRYSMPGDFGKYTMGGLGASFAADPRSTGSQPRTKGQIRAVFWNGLAAREGEIPALAQAALAANAARETARSRSWRLYLPELPGPAHPDEGPDAEVDEKDLERRLEAAEAALMAATGLERRDFSYPGHDDDQIIRFSNETGRRWVAWRTLDLGWREAVHSDLEERTVYHRGRSQHAVERIGKKYQWIAYHELLGVLADHYWHIGWREVPDILTDILQVEDLDIDLSFVPGRTPPWPTPIPELCVAKSDIPPPETEDAAILWAETLGELPEVATLVDREDADGTSWWLVSGSQRDANYLGKLQTNGPMRTAQGFIQMIIIGRDDVALLHQRQSLHRFDNGDMLDRDYSHSRTFGEQQVGLVETQAILDRRINGVRYGLPAVRFNPYRGEYDFGGGEDGPFEIPRRWMIDALALRPAGPASPWFINPVGSVGFIDPEGFGETTAGALVNGTILAPALAARDLTVAWFYWGEKDGGDGSDDHFRSRRGRFVRATYCGLWWREGSEWKGSNWRAKDSRPRVAFENDEPDFDQDIGGDDDGAVR